MEFLVLPDWGTGRGWHTEKTFDIDDFVFAESETKENLLKGSQDPDIVFMRLVERAMTKQWLGFDPHEVLQESVTEPVIKTIDKSTAAITKELRRPWEKAPMPVNDNDAVAAIKENTAVLKEIREKIPAQKTHEPAVNSDKLAKKRRNKVSDMQYHAAIKLIIDEKMNQNDAETRCGLWQGAMSSGKGKKMLETAIAEVSRIKSKTVSDDVGKDYIYNETRYNGN